METFKGQYCIYHGQKRVQRTQTFATVENWQQQVEALCHTLNGEMLTVLVYAYPEGTTPEENKGKYSTSDFCTNVAAEIKHRLRRREME